MTRPRCVLLALGSAIFVFGYIILLIWAMAMQHPFLAAGLIGGAVFAWLVVVLLWLYWPRSRK